MCLIIASPWGERCDKADITTAWTHNDDGWGIMTSDGTRVRVQRGLDLPGLLKAYEKIPESQPYAIHLRFGTAGSKTVVNCHPFPVGHGYHLMHNGILPIKRVREDRSDTWHFATVCRAAHGTEEALLDALPFIEREIGKENKFVLMSPKGDIEILNEKSGDWDGGLWYSNWYSLMPPVDLDAGNKYISASASASPSPIHPWAWDESEEAELQLLEGAPLGAP